MGGTFGGGGRDGHRGKENERFSNRGKREGLTVKEKERTTKEVKRGSFSN